MKKQLICLLMVMILLAGCTNNSNTVQGAASTTAVEPSATVETAESSDNSVATASPAGTLQVTNMPFSYPEKTRFILTTDGECDDYNSLHHLLLYANDFDFAGIIYSASTYHFQGDGVHTLEEVTKDSICAGENPDQLKEYRPQEMGWIEKTITEEYAVDYVLLVENDPSYPTPEQLLYVVKVGNVAFEGDVREASEGSDWIASCILDDDTRPLYIASWGGFNTVARALLTIHDVTVGPINGMQYIVK